IRVGFHGHDQVDRPDEVSTEETFKTVMAASQYHCANLDIGHYTAANGDPIAFIQKYHDRITNLHLKDRKKNHGENVPWDKATRRSKRCCSCCRRTATTSPGTSSSSTAATPSSKWG